MTHFEKLLEQIRNDELASEIEVIVEALNDEAYEQGHADGYGSGYANGCDEQWTKLRIRRGLL